MIDAETMWLWFDRAMTLLKVTSVNVPESPLMMRCVVVVLVEDEMCAQGG